MVKKDVQEAYDEIAETYNERQEAYESDSAQEEIVAEFMDLVPKETRVLDAGCGGCPTESARHTVTGIDISANQLGQYEGEIPVVQGDITNLPFSSDTFHGVTAFYSVIHIPIDQHETLYSEVHRVLKPGGVFLFTEGSDTWIGSNPSWLGSGTEMKWEIAGPEKTKEFLDSTGFEILRTERVVDEFGDEKGEKLFYIVQAREQ